MVKLNILQLNSLKCFPVSGAQINFGDLTPYWYLTYVIVYLLFPGTAKFDGGGTARVPAHTAATPGRRRPARRPCCATAAAAATAAATTASRPAPANTRYRYAVPVSAACTSHFV